MITNKLKELELAKAKVEELQKSVEQDMRRELAGLPAKFGFDSAAAFIFAVKAASGGRRGRPVKNGAKKRSRAVITDETRAEVKKLVAAGKTGSEIADGLGISLPSVQNIKKALGLVKSKKS